MVEPVDDQYCNVITIKGKDDAPKRKTPFVLKGPTSNASNMIPTDACSNVVTQSCARIVLKYPEPSATTSNPTTEKTAIGPTNKASKLVPLTTTANYNILDQLK